MRYVGFDLAFVLTDWRNENVMKFQGYFLFLVGFLFIAASQSREVEDFNFDWQFHLGDAESAYLTEFDSSDWAELRLPHDWLVSQPYTQENTASSTGFKPGGVGWYRKTFNLSQSDLSRSLWLEFDGIYNNAQIWVNGHLAAERSYGYSSFSVALNEHVQAGSNLIAVRVDRSAYADSRWYTGAGIYRSVRLIKTHSTHIPQWGVQILTPSVTNDLAEVSVKTRVSNLNDTNQPLYLEVILKDPSGDVTVRSRQKIDSEITLSQLDVSHPKLWDIEHPHLYSAQINLLDSEGIRDSVKQDFGIRRIAFSASNGFLLNGHSVKLKGVNLHHDGGALGAAVPKAIWRLRLEQLKSVGVNAIRTAHNPHSPDLLSLADEMGFVVIAEAFDDWQRAKDKSMVFLSDNAAKSPQADSYNKHFNSWSERDLKDMIRRDFNHPSIIMWSIGNEIEWTYPYYAASQVYAEEKSEYYRTPPIYAPEPVKQSYQKNRGKQQDHLVLTANRLAGFVKELDTSRPVTAGLVIPSVGFVSGYTDALDVVGFNYRAVEYDLAHKTYPDKPIYGSENWGSWDEWKAARDRDFVPGIFIWTGFAYKGEAGPWPRKGLEISLFDFAGHKTPRGHLFESFWMDKAKVHLATIPQKDSEYQFNSESGWTYTEKVYPEPKMQWLRPWEWYGVTEKWNYPANEKIVVQVYANTEQSELFLNGKSLGRQAISDDNNRILLWQVPFQKGELKVVGYNQDKAVAEHAVYSHGKARSLSIKSSKPALLANRQDVVQISVSLLDGHGYPVVTEEQEIEFSVQGAGELLATDNGWENNVTIATASKVQSYEGRAFAYVRSLGKQGNIKVTAQSQDGLKADINITSR